LRGVGKSLKKMKKALALAALAAFTTMAAAAFALEVYPLAPGERITLDGRLDEPAWAHARVFDRFWDVSPTDHQSARVKTEVRFAHDRDSLYVAVWAHDPGVGELRAPFARRDNVLSDQDMVVLFIDPVGNRKFAHFFRVNPRGSIGDGLYNEDTSNEDFSPDLEFEVVTGRFEGGWTAEFRIPFSSLRYTDPPSPQWSFLVFRNYPRDQRYRMASSELPREQTCFLCLNEPLTGLATLPATTHLAVTPNVTVRSVTNREAGERTRRDNDIVASVDAKWRPRADVVVDATVNPDFSQVELDAPQLAGNTQFALFFPEKRPFFLEGADILQSPTQVIYTRTVTDPAWGVRATQRSGQFDGTVLVTRDEGGGLVLLPGTYGTGAALQDFHSLASFARGRWQMGGLTLGGVLTDRTIDGGAYNRVAGPDVVWFPDTENRFRGQFLGSWTTARAVNGEIVKGDLAQSHAALADWSYHGKAWDQYLDAEDVGREFRADNGFVGQNGYRRLYSETTRKFLDVGAFNDVSPYFFADYKTDPEGRVQYRQTNMGLRLGLPRATTVWLEYRPDNLTAVRPGGGLRKRDQVYFGLESNPFPWFARFFTEVAYGDRLDVANNRIGTGAYYSIQASVRPHARAEVEYRIDNDFIDSLEPAAGSRRIIAQRVQQLLALWHFSARDSVRLIWQAVGVRRAPSLWTDPVAARENTQTFSLVYGHYRALGTTLYLGVTTSRTRIPDSGVHGDQVEVFAKGSWRFDIL
jgi:hypothetical protein